MVCHELPVLYEVPFWASAVPSGRCRATPKHHILYEIFPDASARALEAAQGPTITSVRRRLVPTPRARNRAGAAQHLAEICLMWRRGRGHIIVERAGLGFWDVPIRECRDDEAAPVTAASRHVDFITDAYLTMWLSALTIDQDLSPLAGALRLGPRLEHAGNVEPHIQTDHSRS